MKAAPVYAALAARNSVRQTLVHSGQHYDFNMSDVFFEQLGLPAPEINLQVGSGSHAQQTGQIISRFEEVILEQKPDMVVVYGDVNSTVAAALVCAKLLVPVAHVEAGLRSFDRSMPEEINRLLTDQISSLLFTPSADGNENLTREGVTADKVHLVGNVMIDTLVRMLPQTAGRIPSDLPSRYVLVTLHRPSNVDQTGWLSNMLQQLSEISDELPVWFPVHPRTRERLRQVGFNGHNRMLRLMDPRDNAVDDRLKVLNSEEGVWRCHTQFNCVAACPKGLNLTDSIMRMKRAMLRPGKFHDKRNFVNHP